VLKILAAIEKKELEDIILVDGLQSLPHEAGSPFYGVLTSLASLSNNSGKQGYPFVTCCVSATVETPVDEWLGVSSQRRSYLVPPKLDGSKVIKEATEDQAILISDMGGHARCLEHLQTILMEIDESSTLKDISLNFFLH
jgi:hypothetical protein